MLRINQLKMPLKHSKEEIVQKLLKLLNLPKEQLISYDIVRCSLDARKADDIHYTYSVDFVLKEEAQFLKKNKNKDIAISNTVEYKNDFKTVKKLEENERPVVCGSGPAGMFCAYFLAQAGMRPILIERGEPVEDRVKQVDHFWTTGDLNPESNVQFGEGGAGTFSDGKLNTMVKDTSGRIRCVLKTYVKFGAPEDILYRNKPHIGTDELRRVVVNMRNEILALGGEIHFQTKMTDIVLKDNKIVAVKCVSLKGLIEIATNRVVLAIGHSARDTFEMLMNKGIGMEEKPFAVGVRVEHDQNFIDRAQYKAAAGLLPAADYKLTAKAGDGRGVYSFCMCPGGFVVNASSEQGHLVVNGMSNRDRAERNANSALIVTVTPEDFRKYTGISGPLSGIAFQRKFEKMAYDTCSGKIPYQLYGDLKAGRESTGYGKIVPNHKGMGAPADLRKCLPQEVTEALLDGMLQFDHSIRGFADDEAVFSGVEMRTSSPIRITRDESYRSNIRGVYPCGEGAGYAGGITSAAVDGIKVYEAIMQEIVKE